MLFREVIKHVVKFENCEYLRMPGVKAPSGPVAEYRSKKLGWHQIDQVGLDLFVNKVSLEPYPIFYMYAYDCFHPITAKLTHCDRDGLTYKY